MSGSSPQAPDDSRISTAAALVALGGHAVVVLAALLLSARGQTLVAAPGVVGVTLVSGAPGGAPALPPAAPAAAPTASRPVPPRPVPDANAGERLDRLIAPEAAAPASTSAAAGPDRPSDGGQRGGSGVAANSSPASGSSRADQGLGQGEGAEGIDLYAAASLPNVGARPASPPAGDLWKQVAPCWRSASPRKATLMVEIGDDGRLTGSPKAVRKIPSPADAPLLLAERAAARALQACAPYSGLGGRSWRVEFPALSG
ncbi:hypothetical protein ASD38_22945 [Caulobacter sp. Root487D2Y]|uniref:hypothetical protein n=1 Tax=Caulobacter sp. Root487D2Y TaxID=1736547 RepID=UPI00070065A3|nr:hypothetical protein [Caulobacter sp. Root487D2Y]KQY31922.1 hypothetical protein ASD38_22945 [Caulobacter sp. Root487D2Y]